MCNVFGFVIYGGFRAQLVHNPPTFLVAACDADHPATLQPAELADKRTHGTCRSGDHECIAHPWFAVFDHAEVGGVAAAAEHMHKRGWWQAFGYYDLANRSPASSVRNHVLLPAEVAHDQVAGCEAWMLRLHHLGQTVAIHGPSDRNRTSGDTARNQCHAHGRIHPDVPSFQKHVAGCHRRYGLFVQLEVAWFHLDLWS